MPSKFHRQSHSDYYPLSPDDGERILSQCRMRGLTWAMLQQIGSSVKSHMRYTFNQNQFGFDPENLEEYFRLFPSWKSTTQIVKCESKHDTHTKTGIVVRVPFYSDGPIQYVAFICDDALHSALASSQSVTDFRLWREEYKKVKGKGKHMKAPTPKTEFGDLERWRRLGAGKKGGVKATIVSHIVNGEYGWQVPFKVDKEEFLQTLKETSKNYERLFTAFGDDFDMWVGETVTARIVQIEDGKYAGQDSLWLEAAES